MSNLIPVYIFENGTCSCHLALSSQSIKEAEKGNVKEHDLIEVD